MFEGHLPSGPQEMAGSSASSASVLPSTTAFERPNGETDVPPGKVAGFAAVQAGRVDIDLTATQDAGTMLTGRSEGGEESDGPSRKKPKVEPPAEEDGLAHDMRRAMELECDRWRAEQYRTWEEWEMRNAMAPVPVSDGNNELEVTIRGGVRHRGGILGPTQSMLFNIAADGRIELSFSARVRSEVQQRGCDEAEPRHGGDLPADEGPRSHHGDGPAKGTDM